MSIIDRIDRLLNRDETTTTPAIAQNLAKGHVDVIGEIYKCPYCGFEKVLSANQKHCDACGKEIYRLVRRR